MWGLILNNPLEYFYVKLFVMMREYFDLYYWKNQKDFEMVMGVY